MTCSICQQSGHNKRTCPNQQKATTGKYAGMTATQIEAIFAERERQSYEELVAPIVAPKSACADCGQIETECRLERVGGKIMCCDCLDPKPTEEEEDDETETDEEEEEEEEEEEYCECPDCGDSFYTHEFSHACCDKCWVGDCDDELRCEVCEKIIPDTDEKCFKISKKTGHLVCGACLEKLEEENEDERCRPTPDTNEMTTTHEFVLPTADNLDELYTEEEQKKIYEALKAKFVVGHPYDNTPHTYCEECDCCVACDCCVCDGEGGQLHECPDCENTFSDAQIESGEVVSCVRCDKCFVGDCGKTKCDCVFDDEKDELCAAIDASGNALF